MTQYRPRVTATTHELPFDKLPCRDTEARFQHAATSGEDYWAAVLGPIDTTGSETARPTGAGHRGAGSCQVYRRRL
jgi:hypothetical protein